MLEKSWHKLLICGGAMLISATAAAQDDTLSPIATLEPTTANTFFFADHVEGNVNWLFVGSPRETSARQVSDGAVYIYRQRGGPGSFEFMQRIEGTGQSPINPGQNNSGFGDRFGSGLAASGPWLFVAAANGQPPNMAATQFAGTVEVFYRSGDIYEHVQSLSSPTAENNGGFGSRTDASHLALSHNGKLLLVGESGNAGAKPSVLYQLSKDGQWQLIQTILPPGNDLSSFGNAVATLGNGHFLISSRAEEPGAQDPAITNIVGAVHAYEIGKDGLLGFNPLQSIVGDACELSPDLATPATFGDGLSVGGNTVAIADGCADIDGMTRAGSVSIYCHKNGHFPPLSLVQKIDGDTAGQSFGSNFGAGSQAVAVSHNGRTLLIGSGAQDGGFAGREVQVHDFSQRNGWTLDKQLATAGENPFFFGQSVAFFGHNIALASTVAQIDPVGVNSGSVEIFDLRPSAK